MEIYYCVLKNYKGKFEKTHKGNTHLFFVPLTNNEYLYLGLLGELIDQPKIFATQLILRSDASLVDPLIDGEEEHFGDRFLVLEFLEATTHQVNETMYYIKVKKGGSYIKSDLKLAYSPEHSSDKQKIYFMNGELNFEADDVDPTRDLRMLAVKQMAFMGDLNRLSVFKKKK